ncbi:MAG: DsbA family protein [Jaaginema sp. PMC 1079.18]|nr:DsbA family protein [Jaaginema sp. PMC 1080.18]MEC4853367.1 DsbA family protein [Jaaginema sp. PMC 1079.18]MEC4866402.1 DsbA family protein [Jaaginema sp. PMC 1078.18]
MKIIVKIVVTLILFSSLILTPFSAQAANISDSELETKVLEIIRNNPEVIIESLQSFQAQQQQEVEAKRQAVLNEMKGNPTSFIRNSPVTGSSQKNIVLFEFSDFQCPFCAQAHDTLKTFMTKHGDRVTLVYKHLPLVRSHPEALPAAFSAFAAQQQGKFWEYHDALFENQARLGEDLYQEIARNVGLNLEQFERDRTNISARRALQEDLQLAEALMIQGTPFLVMNGEVIPGAVELAEFEQVLEKVSQ